MSRYRNLPLSPENGGEWDERLFNEQIMCDRCYTWFNDDEVTESNTLGGHYCHACWLLEEEEHYNHPDYAGDEFD